MDKESKARHYISRNFNSCKGFNKHTCYGHVGHYDWHTLSL